MHPAAFHIVISRRLKCSQDAYDKSSQGKGSQEDINLLLMVQKSIGEEEDYGIGKENHESFPLLIASPERLPRAVGEKDRYQRKRHKASQADHDETGVVIPEYGFLLTIEIPACHTGKNHPDHKQKPGFIV